MNVKNVFTFLGFCHVFNVLKIFLTFFYIYAPAVFRLPFPVPFEMGPLNPVRVPGGAQ